MLLRTNGVAPALAVSLACLVACSPELTDRAYSCRTGPCPKGWTCGSDQLCYEKKSDAPGASDDGDRSDGGSERDDAGDGQGNDGGAGTSSVGTGDGGMTPSGRGGDGAGGAGGGAAGSPGGSGGNTGAGGTSAVGGAGGAVAEDYAACNAGDSCPGGNCVIGPDQTATHGVCAPSCSTEQPCPDNAGQPSLCLQGLGKCLAGCSSEADCPGELGCYDMAYAMMQARAVCVDVASPDLLGTAACTPQTMTSCGRGAVCAFSPDTAPEGGVCSYRCDQTRSCPQGGRCVEAFMGSYQCLKPCDEAGECGALSCGMFVGMQLCVPQGWVGRLTPLPPPPAM